MRLQASLSNWKSPHPNDFVAEWFAFTGQRDQAISELEKVVARHDDDALLLAVNPMYDRLHSDQRYLALLRRVGLPLPEAGAVSQ